MNANRQEGRAVAHLQIPELLIIKGPVFLIRSPWSSIIVLRVAPKPSS